jgi:SAM-dependent methyltransferase
VLRAEAAWLARELERLAVADLSPLLSVGSGHAELTGDQPWIHGTVYAPLEQRGVRVLHHELEPAVGVDVAGDLTDAAFRASLENLEIRSVMCCNVLEHVPEPNRIAATLERLIAPGGYALVTVPRRYPYHPGPIDTMFRPTAAELRALFPALTEVKAEEVRCESLAAYLLASPRKRTAIARGVRSFAHRSNGGPEVPLRDNLRMLFASTAVSAVILRRQ